MLMNLLLVWTCLFLRSRLIQSAALITLSKCNSTDSTYLYNITLVIKFGNDSTGSGISWSMVDYWGTNVLDSNDIDVEDYSKITQIVCLDSSSNNIYDVSNNDCFELDFENSNDDSMDIYFDVLYNNKSVTWDSSFQLWDDSQFTFYFCQDFIQTGTGQDLNNLTLVTDYDSLIEITNVTNSNEELVYQNEINTDEIHSLFITDGCYDVTLYDDTSNNNNDNSDNDNNGISLTQHGSFTIYVNGETGGVGGYYYDSDTRTICTDMNHVSFCIIPGYCNGNNDIYISNYEYENNNDALYSYSYQSLYNLTYNYILDNVENIDCYGSHSCANSELILADVACFGAFSCVDSILGVDRRTQAQSVTCYGVGSCMNGELSWTRSNSIRSNGIQTLNNLIVNFVVPGNSLIELSASFSIMNSVIYLNVTEFVSAGSVGLVRFEIQGSDYSLYNTTIKCSHLHGISLSVSCLVDVDTQYFMIDDSCYGNNTVTIADCDHVNSTQSFLENIDNSTLDMIEQLSTLIDIATEASTQVCKKKTTTYCSQRTNGCGKLLFFWCVLTTQAIAKL